MVTRRAFIAFAALALAAGCSKTGDVDFTINKHYTDVASPGGTFGPTVEHVDLSSEASEAWGHRDKIKSVELVDLGARVTALSTPTSVNGTITLARGASRAVVGSWPSVTVSGVPHDLSVALNHDAMSIVNDALHGDGKFDVEFVGSTSNAVTFSADVSLHMKMTYKISVP